MLQYCNSAGIVARIVLWCGPPSSVGVVHQAKNSGPHRAA
jgi:hypothetical protein